MGKVTRDNISRGIQLVPQHLTTPLSGICTEISTVDKGVDIEQLQNPDGSFRVNINIPVLDSYFFRNNPLTPWYVPFVLPPLQQYFSDDGVSDEETPAVILTEVSFGFDQRGEAAAIAGQYVNNVTSGLNPDEGKLLFDVVDRLSLRLSICEHEQDYWKGLATANDPALMGREVFGIRIPPEAYASPDFRQNPLVVTDISSSINPYRTYCFAIYAPGLATDYGVVAGKAICLPSIQVSMKFSTKLHTRLMPDDTLAPQNLPTSLPDNKVKFSTAAIIAPAAGTIIEAETTDGVQTSLARVDGYINTGYNAGYRRMGNNEPTEILEPDSCYEVITIPLMQGGYGNDYRSDHTHMAHYPYVYIDPYSKIADARRVSINHPLVIHHAFIALNFFSPDGAFTYVAKPTSATLDFKVGLAMGTGLRGDSSQYQQIAYLDYTGSSLDWSANRVDRVSWPADSSWGVLPATSYEWAIHQVPLVGAGGEGHYAQGNPIYVGKGTGLTFDRTDIGQLVGAPTAPNTLGAEQFLVASIAFSDANGLCETHGVAPNEVIGAAGSAYRTYVGQGGCFLYLICEKTLTDGERR